MTTQGLADAVLRFADATHALPEYILDNDAYAWGDYEGVRYAFLHTTMALRGLAGRLLAERFRGQRPVTFAQHALAEHHAALRDFQSLLIGVPDEIIATNPKPDEWPIRTILVHVHDAERYFYAAIMNSLDEMEPHEPSDAEAAAMLDEPERLPMDLPLAGLWASYERAHILIQDRLEGLTDDEVYTPSTMWESAPQPVLFRIERFAAHVREHTNQLEKTLRWLGRAPNEAKLLLRQMFAALAQVEGVRLGMGEMGEEACNRLASEIDAHLADLTDALTQAEAMIAAVRDDDVEKARSLLHAKPALARTIMEDGLSAVLYSKYRGREKMVAALLTLGLRLPMPESAALGETARVRRILEYSRDYANSMSRDGFTALQLASYFGHPEVAGLLLEAGADIHAVSQNGMRLHALHSAVAGRNVECVKLLIAAGADVNARQEGGFTPLMAAQQNGDEEIEALLRDAGAQEST
jgi:hypothetical protein